MFSAGLIARRNRMRSLVVTGLAVMAGLSVAQPHVGAEPLVNPMKSVTLPGFTREGWMKVGDTDRQSGVFPPDVKAYPLETSGVYVLDPLVAARMSGETDVESEAAADGRSVDRRWVGSDGAEAAAPFHGIAAIVPPVDVIGLPGFTLEGLLKVGMTDRESGVFPPEVEAYRLQPTRFYVLDPAVAGRISETDAASADGW